MRVLVVSPVVPFEGIAHAGGLYLLRHLARLRGGTVTLMAPDAPENRADRKQAPDWLEVVLAPHQAPRPGGLQQQRDRLEHRLRGPSPLPYVMRGLLAAGLVARARDADLVELQWPEYAHLAPVLRRSGVRTPLVVLEHDVAAQAARHVLQTDDTVDRVSSVLLSRRHRRQERRALEAADLLLVFKAADEALLRRLGVATPVQVLDPWLEPPAPSYEDRDPRSVLFTGALWRTENDQGARWMLELVWPRVLAAVPDARLILAGDRPSPALRTASQRTPGVELTGRLPDLEPVYRRAGVFAAPLFTGGGLKFKVPQAMVYGLPVIGTTVAAEGIVEVAPPGMLWAVTDDVEPFAQAVVDALLRPEAAAQVGRRAARWVQEHYSFARSGDELRRAYAALTGTTGETPEPGA